MTIRQRNGTSTSDDVEASTAPETSAAEQPESVPRGSVLEVFLVAGRLGLTSFGGPIAHLAYFRDEYVVKRRWLDEKSYADLVALCQFLPGAASSKLGMSIGILRAGPVGGLFAWLGFTLPSAIALTIAALTLGSVGVDTVDLLHGLKVVAVAVVAQAVWGMARNLAPDRPRATIAALSTAAVLLLPVQIGQITVIVLAGLVGWRLLRSQGADAGPGLRVPIPRWFGIACWVALIGLLIGLPLARTAFGSQTLALFDSAYRSGALVFGGGHVVLPLLQAEMVPTGWVGQDQFLAGYGLAQAVPGPLFTFGAYLGAAMGPAPHGVIGATIALVAIFLPSMLLTYGALPWWGVLRTRPAAQAALRGINAGVVGILLAALYNPVWTSAILRPIDFVIAMCAFLLLTVWRCPPWIVVLLAGVAGMVVA
ncbi:chromate transporter [Kribbella shirazensis]|uniref:Chromate transporter n=1 Tax=Kribbella shirazensis TaxID=1105143 RepID=A0A7X5VJB9_9ACTN|nr:chromate transporter [Kribbella shirazensis]